MDCDRAREEFSALLDGELPPDVQAAVDAHLAGCSDCLRELEKYQRVGSLYAGLQRVAAPADLEDRVREQLRPVRNTLASRRRRRSWAPWLAAAAVFLMMLGGAWQLLWPMAPQNTPSYQMASEAQPERTRALADRLESAPANAPDAHDLVAGYDIDRADDASPTQGKESSAHERVQDLYGRPEVAGAGGGFGGGGGVGGGAGNYGGAFQFGGDVNAGAGGTQRATAAPAEVGRRLRRSRGDDGLTLSTRAGPDVPSAVHAKPGTPEPPSVGSDEATDVGGVLRSLGYSEGDEVHPSDDSLHGVSVKGRSLTETDGAVRVLPEDAPTRQLDQKLASESESLKDVSPREIRIVETGVTTRRADAEPPKESGDRQIGLIVLDAPALADVEIQAAPPPASAPPAPAMVAPQAQPEAPVERLEPRRSGEMAVVTAARTLRFRDGVWTQSEYRGEDPISITRDSDAWRGLVEKDPSLADFASLEASVIFRAFEVWYRLEAPKDPE